MKLSKKLIEILVLMNTGWELGHDDTCSGSCHWRIQEGGLGWGGKAIYPHGRTKVRTLIQLDFIAHDGKHHFPTTPYFLTGKGKQFLKELK